MPTLPDVKSKTYSGVQFLRGAAALMVVYHHCIILLNERFGIVTPEWINGASGVDVFFVISGFVMAISSRSLLSHPHGAQIFITKRLERIVPLYWLATSLKVALVFLVPAMAVKGGYSLSQILASYMFLPIHPVLVVGWTLNYEMLFYALFAICIAMNWKLIPTLPLALGLIVALPLLGYAPIALEFIGGIMLAEMKPFGSKVSFALLIAGTAAILLPPNADGSNLRVLLWGIPAMMIVSGIVWIEGKWRVPSWLFTLGDASYSIYLFHAFVLPPMAVVLSRLHLGRVASVIAVDLLGLYLSAVIGVIVHKAIEKPIVEYFRRPQRKSRPVVAYSSSSPAK
jgi:peptidoglycan/LPS O-acetylase OafA/YrhL